MKVLCEKCSVNKKLHYSEIIELKWWLGIPAIELQLSCGHGIFITVKEITLETYKERYKRLHQHHKQNIPSI